MSNPNQLVPPAGSALPAASEPRFDLRSLTPARVALDRTGSSLTTRHALEFSLAHAQARDAVHSALAVPSLLAALRERSLTSIHVRSAAANRTEYLRRPDLGRTLAPASAAQLATNPSAASIEPGAPFTQSHRVSGVALQNPTIITLILADGLSALAIERHALPVLDALQPLLKLGEPDSTWRLTSIVVAEQARVALADPVGQALHADATVILIGERPGLSSPDSLGAYITWAPRPGLTDAERNCISNIRSEGLDYAAAAGRIAWTLTEARRLGLTGVALRESGTALLP
jgi:ethanolamine ammonia-lyase small subunit